MFFFLGLGVIWVIGLLMFPAICAGLARRWGFPLWLGLMTGLLWGPLGIVALWSADAHG